jgi:hydroxymethylbilane synthase
MPRPIILGTRGSALALAQAGIVSSRLQPLCPGVKIDISVIATSGDLRRDESLSEIGGKGVFIKELEHALLNRRIDIAVHSMKDVTSRLADGLSLSGFLAAESVRDVLVYREKVPFERIPSGAVIGTGSMRRKMLLSKLRPDLATKNIRGNVETRIKKVRLGECDGVIVSEAGLIRLGRTADITHVFDPAAFYPAPGQGVIALQTHKDDARSIALCDSITDPRQRIVSEAEYAFLSTLGFDCRQPVGVYSTLLENRLIMKGFFSDPETGGFFEHEVQGPAQTNRDIGRELAEKFLENKLK